MAIKKGHERRNLSVVGCVSIIVDGELSLSHAAFTFHLVFFRKLFELFLILIVSFEPLLELSHQDFRCGFIYANHTRGFIYTSLVFHNFIYQSLSFLKIILKRYTLCDFLVGPLGILFGTVLLITVCRH